MKPYDCLNAGWIPRSRWQHTIVLLCCLAAMFIMLLPVRSSSAGYRPINGDEVSSSVGIWFSESVPFEIRQSLISDFDWLASAAPPEFKQAVASILGSSATDGASLAYDLTRRMPVVVGYTMCLDDRIGVSTTWRDDEKWTFRPLEPTGLPDKPILCPSERKEQDVPGFWSGGAAIRDLLSVTDSILGESRLRLSGMPKNWQKLALRIDSIVYEIPGPEANVVFVSHELAELDRRDRILLMASDLRQLSPEQPVSQEEATAAATWRQDFRHGRAKGLIRTTFVCGQPIECFEDVISSAEADIALGSAVARQAEPSRCDIVLANNEWRVWTEDGTGRFLLMSNAVPVLQFQYRGRIYPLGVQLFAVNAGRGFVFSVVPKPPKDTPMIGLEAKVLQHEIAPLLFARSREGKLEIEVDGNLEYTKQIGTDALQDLPNLFEYARLGETVQLRMEFVGGNATWTMRSQDMIGADALAVRIMDRAYEECADSATLAKLDNPEAVGALAWEQAMASLDASLERVR